MGPVVFVMAILGCGEADTACQPVTTLPTRYESRAACDAATEDMLARQDDILFPVVVAQCAEADKAAAGTVMANEVRLPEPGEPQLRRARALENEQARG